MEEVWLVYWPRRRVAQERTFWRQESPADEVVWIRLGILGEVYRKGVRFMKRSLRVLFLQSSSFKNPRRLSRCVVSLLSLLK